MRDVDNKIYKGISVTDLSAAGLELDIVEIGENLRVTGGRYLGKEENVETIHKALYRIGIDTVGHFEVTDKIHHRNGAGDQVVDHRIIGLERTDMKWIKSGNASDEAKMSKSKMRDMVMQTNRLASGGGS